MAPRIFVACMTALGICVYPGTRVETQAPPDTPVVAALLEEVRALRVTIETIASAGASGQLALGRLQLQEQRLNATIGKLDVVRERLATGQREAAQARDELARFESMLKENPSAVATMHQYGGELVREREAVEEMLKFTRSQIAAMNADIQRLTIEEATLANDVVVEQARWWDAHRRLEDIENRLMGQGAHRGGR